MSVSTGNISQPTTTSSATTIDKPRQENLIQTEERKITHEQKKWPHSLALLFLLAFVAILGAAPHLYFSLEVGEVSFFKGAFDEDTYVLFLDHNVVPLSRLLSSTLIGLLRSISGGSTDIALIAADVIFPVLTAATAWFLASGVFSRPLSRLLLCVVILFGGEFISLANSAVWNGSSLSLAWFRGFFGSYGNMLVPASESSYITLFRTPEPQVVYPFAFLALGAVIRLFDEAAGAPDRRRSIRLAVLLIASTMALAISYIFLSVPTVLLFAGLIVVTAILSKWRVAGMLLLACLASLGVIAWGAAASQAGMGLIFASRLPIITPSVVIALAVLLLATVKARKVLNNALGWMAVGLISMPMFLVNQQLITGIMVSARDWERYANYPFLIIGIALLLKVLFPARAASGTASARRNSLVGTGLVAGLTAYICIALAGAQQTSYSFWISQNLEAKAAARVVLEAVRDLGLTPRLLYASPGIAPHVAVRTGGTGVPVLDYTSLFLDPIPLMDAEGKIPGGAQHRTTLFEYWARMSIEPAQADELLRSEAAQQSGFYSGFLFNFLDHWYPASDSRHVRTDAILASIGEVVTAYKQFLLSWTPGGAEAPPVLLITTQAVDELAAKNWWQYQLIATAEAGGLVMHAYLQTASRTEAE